MTPNDDFPRCQHFTTHPHEADEVHRVLAVITELRLKLSPLRVAGLLPVEVLTPLRHGVPVRSLPAVSFHDGRTKLRVEVTDTLLFEVLDHAHLGLGYDRRLREVVVVPLRLLLRRVEEPASVRLDTLELSDGVSREGMPRLLGEEVCSMLHEKLPPPVNVQVITLICPQNLYDIGITVGRKLNELADVVDRQVVWLLRFRLLEVVQEASEVLARWDRHTLHVKIGLRSRCPVSLGAVADEEDGRVYHPREVPLVVVSYDVHRMSAPIVTSLVPTFRRRKVEWGKCFLHHLANRRALFASVGSMEPEPRNESARARSAKVT